MPDIHLLANRTSLTRLRIAEHVVATASDGDDAAADARARAARLTRVLDVELDIINAVDLRVNARPVVPAPVTLQDLVRSGRRRIERERVGAARDRHTRLVTLNAQLKQALDP